MRLRRHHSVLITVLFGTILPPTSSQVNSTFVPLSPSSSISSSSTPSLPLSSSSLSVDGLPALTLSLEDAIALGEQLPSISPSAASSAPSSPSILSPASLLSRDVIESRSDDESGKGSIFKSIKKPIKSIFKSWFEPSADSLLPDSSSSTYFFAPSSQKNPLKSIVPKAFTTGAGSPMLSPAPVSRYRPVLHRSPGGSGGHLASAASSPAASYRLSQARRASPTYSIGDPENGRGMTFSVDNGQDDAAAVQQAQQQQAQQAQYAMAAPEQAAQQGEQQSEPQSPGGLSFQLGGNGGGGESGGGGGGRGLSFSFGGGGAGGGGGRGLSFSMGGGGGGGGGGRGLSLSLGGGNGIQLGLGGGGGGIQIGGGGGAGGEAQQYDTAASNSYAYSGQGGGSGGYGQQQQGGYGSGYSNNYDYYPKKPRFSITMPSPGKTVVETNYRPPTLKMKVNASPKVKITTGTRDPLEKNEDEEVITEDIFGEPAPFPKPENKTKTDGSDGAFNGTFPMGMGGFNFTHSPYPYMPYYPMHPSMQMYAQYYQQYYPQYYQYYQQQFASMQNFSMPGMPGMPEAGTAQPDAGTAPESGYDSGAGNSYGSYGKSYKHPNPYKHDTIAIASQMHMLKAQPPHGGSGGGNMIPMQNAVPGKSTVPMSISRMMGGAPRPTMVRSARRPAAPMTPSANFRRSRAPYRAAPAPATTSNAFAASSTYPSYASSPRSPNRAVLLRSNKRSSTPFVPSTSFPSAGVGKPDAMAAMGSAQMLSYAKPQQHTQQLQQKIGAMYNHNAHSNHHNALYSPPSPRTKQLAGQSNDLLTAPSSPESKSYYQFHSSDAKGKSGDPAAYYPAYHHYPSSAGAAGQNDSEASASSTPYSSPYSADYYQQLYSNPAYYNYYQQYYQYAKQYYEHYYANQSHQMSTPEGAKNDPNNHSMDSHHLNRTMAEKNETSAADRIKFAPYSKQLLSGFNQNNLDWHQAKKFGSRVEKHHGGTTSEEKSKIVLDIRPRLTIRMLNRTQAEEEQRKLQKKKDKDHIFKTRLTILMETTTTPRPSTKPANYYKYNYYDDEDEFGYTKAPHTPEPPTTARPKTTTTRRRTTTTEEPGESGEEDSESTSGESSTEDSSTTSSTTTEAPSDSEEDVKDEEDTKTTSTTTSTTTTTTEKIDDVIDESEEKDEDEDKKKPEPMTHKDKQTESEEEKDNDEEKVTKKPSSDAAVTAGTGAVTASPELVAAMVKALQEAFSNNPAFIATTPSPTITETNSVKEDGGDNDSAETTDENDENNNNISSSSTTMKGADKKDKDKDCPPDGENKKSDSTGNDNEDGDGGDGGGSGGDDEEMTMVKKDKDQEDKSAANTSDEDLDDGKDGGSSAQVGDDDDSDSKTARSKLIPTVFSAVVTNTTQLRLKTPVVTMQSRKNRPQALALTTTTTKHSSASGSSRNSLSKSSSKSGTKTQMVNVRKGSKSSPSSSSSSRKSSSTSSSKRSPSKTLSMSASNSRIVVTTTSPLRSSSRSKTSKNRSKKSQKSSSSLPRVIDGDAVLKAAGNAGGAHNVNVDDLSDDERKDMLTNILQIVQSQRQSNELSEVDSGFGGGDGDDDVDDDVVIDRKSSRKSSSARSKKGSGGSGRRRDGAKLLPVTKANNVKIISSLDELKDRRHSGGDSGGSQPVYVVLMPQNKRKK